MYVRNEESLFGEIRHSLISQGTQLYGRLYAPCPNWLRDATREVDFRYHFMQLKMSTTRSHDSVG